MWQRLLGRYNNRRHDSQAFGAARKSTVIEAHEFRAMATGQKVQRIGKVQPIRVPGQGIGDARPFLNADVGQPKQVFDNPHEILGRKTIKGAQDPFEFEDHGNGYEYLRGFGQDTTGYRALSCGLGVGRVGHIETRQDVGIKGDHL